MVVWPLEDDDIASYRLIGDKLPSYKFRSGFGMVYGYEIVYAIDFDVIQPHH